MPLSPGMIMDRAAVWKPPEGLEYSLTLFPQQGRVIATLSRCCCSAQTDFHEAEKLEHVAAILEALAGFVDQAHAAKHPEPAEPRPSHPLASIDCRGGDGATTR